METLKSTTVDWKKITVVGALVILTGLTVGLITWFIMDDLSAQESENYQNQISTLEAQNIKLSEDLESCIESQTVAEEDVTAIDEIDELTPIEIPAETLEDDAAPTLAE